MSLKNIKMIYEHEIKTQEDTEVYIHLISRPKRESFSLTLAADFIDKTYEFRKEALEAWIIGLQSLLKSMNDYQKRTS